MKLHDQAVIETHSGEFGEHLRTEQLGFRCSAITVQRLAVERLAPLRIEIGGCRRRVAVIGGGCTH